MEVRNKKIIVTGAASGIGEELVKQLLDKGAKVVAVDVNKENLNKLESLIGNDNLDTYVLDVSDRKAIKKFGKWYKEKYEKLDILINNAGIIQHFITAEELSEEEIDRVMKVNFFGPVALIQEFMDVLKKKSDSYIVNVSSMGGFFPFPKQTVYGASKAAIKIFTEGLYAETSGTNIHVMVVFPGAIATNITKNSNVEMKGNSSNSSVKMTSAKDAANQIITGIIKNKFKVYIGSDCKFMKFLYKLNPKMAIDFINKKMKDL